MKNLIITKFLCIFCGMIKECKVHGLTEHASRTLYGRKSGWICKKCNTEAAVKSKRRRKLKAIAYKGNKCIICGYDKCVDALEFHHEKDDKQFNISSIGYRMSFENLKLELDKCILVCANCHREIHSEIFGKDRYNDLKEDFS